MYLVRPSYRIGNPKTSLFYYQIKEKERTNMPDKKDDVQIVKMGAWSPGPGCHGGCGVKVYVKNGKLIKVEGDETHPYFQGRLCPRALALTHMSIILTVVTLKAGRRARRASSGYPGMKPGIVKKNECQKNWRRIYYFRPGNRRDAGGPIIFWHSLRKPNWTLFASPTCFTPAGSHAYRMGDAIDAAQFAPRYETRINPNAWLRQKP
jgi:hypothetical protein